MSLLFTQLLTLSSSVQIRKRGGEKDTRGGKGWILLRSQSVTNSQLCLITKIVYKVRHSKTTGILINKRSCLDRDLIVLILTYGSLLHYHSARRSVLSKKGRTRPVWLKPQRPSFLTARYLLSTSVIRISFPNQSSLQSIVLRHTCWLFWYGYFLSLYIFFSSAVSPHSLFGISFCESLRCLIITFWGMWHSGLQLYFISLVDSWVFR